MDAMKTRLAVVVYVLALATMGRAAPSQAAVIAVKVNEVQTGGATASTEFVELYNAGACSADVGGFTLVYRTATGTTDTVFATIPNGVKIAPSDYYLFGTSAFASPVDQMMTGGMASAGGAVGLRDGGNALIDSVGYGTATNAFVEGSAAPAPAASQTIERTPNGHDTNNNSTDFQLKTMVTPDKAGGSGGVSCSVGSVGGIAEEPAVASLRPTAITSHSHRSWYAFILVTTLLVATVGGWAARRRFDAN